MDSTPLWVPLVVAGLGVVGTIVGIVVGAVLTQRNAERREARTWDRERQREQEQWAREDALRTFEHRRQAYADFYEALKAMALVVYNHGLGLTEEDSSSDDRELPFDWNESAFRKLQHLQLYATPFVTEAASNAYSAAWSWGSRTTRGEDDDGFYARQEVYDEHEIQLLQRIRADLGIPGGNLTGVA